MLNKRNFYAVKWLALVLFVITFLVVTFADSLLNGAFFYLILISVFSSMFVCLIF